MQIAWTEPKGARFETTASAGVAQDRWSFRWYYVVGDPHHAAFTFFPSVAVNSISRNSIRWSSRCS
jgi:hypothetical protein